MVLRAGIIPDSVLKSWPEPNLENPDRSGQYLMLGFEIPLIVIVVTFVALRIYTRAVIQRFWGKDDILLCIATVFAIAMMVVDCAAIPFGWGLHFWDWGLIHILEWYRPVRQLAYATQLLYILCATFTKISILVFYLRILHDRGYRMLIHIGIVYMILWCLAFMLTGIFVCVPINAYWDLSVKNAQCMYAYPPVMVMSITNSLSDIFIFLLPIKPMWSLSLPRRERISLVAVFGLGLIVCLASVVRIYYSKVTFHDSFDFTYEGAILYITIAIELDLGIICACIPALKPLFVRIFPHFLHTHSPGSSPKQLGSEYNTAASLIQKPQRAARHSLYPLDSFHDIEDLEDGKGVGMHLGVIPPIGVAREFESDPEKREALERSFARRTVVHVGNTAFEIERKVDIDVRYSDVPSMQHSMQQSRPTRSSSLLR